MFNKKQKKNRKIMTQKEKVNFFTNWLKNHHRLDELTILNFNKYQEHFEMKYGYKIKVYADEVVDIMDTVGK